MRACRLDPLLFRPDGSMIPERRDALLRAARVFARVVGVPWSHVRDVILTGSSAGCGTWDDSSDIDLHLTIDPDSLAACDTAFVENAMAVLSRFFGKTFDPHFGGRQLEVRLQSTDEPHRSQGVYSVLTDRWLVPPRTVDPVVTRIATRVADAVHPRIVAIAEAAAQRGDLDTIERLRDVISTLRRSSLRHHGPGSAGAEIFRALRRRGTLTALADARRRAVEVAMSWPDADISEARESPTHLLVTSDNIRVLDSGNPGSEAIRALPPGTRWRMVRLDPPWKTVDIATDEGRHALTIAARTTDTDPASFLKSVRDAVRHGDPLDPTTHAALLRTNIGAVVENGTGLPGMLVAPHAPTVAYGVARNVPRQPGYTCIADQAPAPGETCAANVWRAAREDPDAAESARYAAMEAGYPDRAADAIGVLSDPRARPADLARAAAAAVDSRLSLALFVTSLLAERGMPIARLLADEDIPFPVRRALAEVVVQTMPEIVEREALEKARDILAQTPAKGGGVTELLAALHAGRGLTPAEQQEVAHWLVRRTGLPRETARRLAAGRYTNDDIVDLLARTPDDRETAFDLAALYRGRPPQLADELEARGVDEDRVTRAAVALTRMLVRTFRRSR